MMKYVLLVSVLFSIFQCATVKALRPPSFNHKKLAVRFFRTNRDGHYPLTVQRGINEEPSVTSQNFMFYTANTRGARDIWLRDLNTTVNIPIIQHDAEQHSPAITSDGKRLLFVSENLNSGGDIQFVQFPRGPEIIKQSILVGNSAPNFWGAAINISERIEKLAEKLGPECRGSFSERSPRWLPDGRLVVFVSDRCSPGFFNLWFMRLGKKGSVESLRQLTREGARQPAVGGERGRLITYLTFTDERPGGLIVIRDVLTGGRTEVDLQRGNKSGDEFLYRSPSISTDGKYLYYISIRKDSNKNKEIDLRDNSAVFRIELDGLRALPETEAQLIDNSNSITRVNYSNFNKGGILYSAHLHNSVNVYFMNSQGIIPRTKNINEQYSLTRKYKNASLKRFLLALDSLKLFFGDSPAFRLYEGRILLDKRQRLRKSTNNKEELVRLEKKLKSTLAKNPFANLLLQFDRAYYAGRDFSSFVKVFIDDFEEKFSAFYTPAERPVVKAAALEALALTLHREHKYKESVAAGEKLLKTNPGYIRKFQIQILELEARMALEQSVPQVALTLLKNTKLPYRYRERIYVILYDYFYTSGSPDFVMELLESELERDEMHKDVIRVLLLVRARVQFDLGLYDLALKDAQKALDNVNKGSGLYVRGKQIIAFALEKQGRYSDSYSARLQYGGAYRPESGVKVELAEYLDIIEESEKYINLYLRTARSIVRSIDDTDDGLAKLIEPAVNISAVEREVVLEFCSPNSRTGYLMLLLGRAKATEYMRFCKDARSFANARKPVPGSTARDAAMFLYMASYANATILNLLFLNIKRVELFKELYKKRAIYYHRLKINIAIEHNERKLEWKSRKFRLVTKEDIQGIIIDKADPFDSSVFRELEAGYQNTSQEARDYGDLSVLYGYAYTLIKKSVQRELFYERLQSSGVRFTNDRLKAFKKAILRDMKDAEYNLQYIILTDPEHVDAYLLLGWLYQYLDEKRSGIVKQSKGVTERVVDWFTETPQVTLTDGRFYKQVYSRYFPEKLYEQNIELYRQALNMTDGLRERQPGAVASLQLSLANNYFKLLNFKRAIAHYNDVEKLTRESGEQIFSGYIQEALFHYNRGRALFYNGQPDMAAQEFRIAYKIYDEQERKPLHEQFSTLNALINNLGVGVNLKVLLRKRKNIIQKIDAVRYKMSLLGSLLGLAYWEAGSYDEAILSYKDAQERLYKGGHPPANAVAQANILNFMALAYQGKNNLDKSDQNAAEADKFARKDKLRRNDSRYLPQSLVSRSLGCVMGYGEDFSVIGEGKNPYGFSPLRQYELALGIQFENHILRGDIRGAQALLRKRRIVFAQRDGKVTLGKLGVITTLNNEGLAEYQLREYRNAQELFKKAAGTALKQGFLKEFRLNLVNQYHALFSFYESGRADPYKAILEIDKSIDDIKKIKLLYGQQTIAAYIEEQKHEYPNFKFDKKTDGVILRKRINRELREFLEIEGGLYYYLGKFREGVSETRQELVNGFNSYKTSIGFYNLALSGLRNKKGEALVGQRQIRIRLNRVRAMAAAGLLYKARDELTELAESVFEFNMLREEWEVQVELGAVFIQIYKIRRNPSFLEQAQKRFLRAAFLLEKNPEIFDFRSDRIKHFYHLMANFLIRRKSNGNALALLERYWELYLQEEFLRYSLKFPDPGFTENHALLRGFQKKKLRLEAEERYLRIKRENTNSVLDEKKKLRTRMAGLRLKMQEKAPSYGKFLTLTEFGGLPGRNLKTGQIILRFFEFGDYLYLWAIRPGSRIFFQEKLGGEPMVSLEKLIRRALPTKRKKLEVYLRMDETTFHYPVHYLLKEILPEPAVIARLGGVNDFVSGFVRTQEEAQEIPPELNFLNVKTFSRPQTPKSYSFDTDIVEFRLARRNTIFSVSQNVIFSPRAWLAKKRFASMVLAETAGNQRNRPDYRTLAGAYEILRAGGVSTMAFKSNITSTERRRFLSKRSKKTLGLGDFQIFGIPGYSRTQLRGLLLERHRQAVAKGRELSEEGSGNEATRFFRIADAYLWRYPGEKNLNLENRILLAREYLLNGKTQRGRILFDKLMRDNRAPGQSVQLKRIMQMYLRALYSINDIKAAAIYLKRFRKRFPKDKIFVQEARELAFLARLRRLKYASKKTRFNKDFKALYAGLSRSSAAWKITEQLFRRGLFTHAWRLASDVARQTHLQEGASEWLFAISQEARLLGNKKIPPVEVPLDLSFAQSMVYLSDKGLWSDYEEALKDKKPGDSLALHKFKLRLFSQWRKYLNKGVVKPQEIANVSLGSGFSVYRKVSQLERILIFRILIDSIEADPEMQTGQYLVSLIKSEARNNHERAAVMALRVSRRFLSQHDISNSVRFFKLYRKHSVKGIPESLDPLLEARTGLALYLSRGAIKYLKKKRNKKLPALWRKRVLNSRFKILLALYEKLPVRFRDSDFQKLNGFIQSNTGKFSGPGLMEDLKIGVGVLKLRAIKRKNWSVAFNLSVFNQKLKTFSVGLSSRRSRSAQFPVYRNDAESIKKKMPAGQSFIAFLDGNFKAYRIKITRGNVTGDDVSYSGRFLRGNMYRYLGLLRHRQPSAALHNKLSWIYRSLFGVGTNLTIYFWFEDIHAFAPIAPERGDRIYQVLDPTVFARNPVRRQKTGFKGNFQVSLKGGINWKRLKLFYSEQELEWRRRLYDMEVISLGKRSKQDGSVQHIVTSIYPDTKGVLRNMSALPAGKNRPWFLVGNRLLEDPRTEILNVLKLNEQLALKFRAPGILLLRRPAENGHAYFVKYFYNRASPANSIERRFVDALLLLRRTLPIDSALYGYRLTTSSIVVETKE